MHTIPRRLSLPLVGALLFTMTTGCAQEQAAGEKAGAKGTSAAARGQDPGTAGTKDGSAEPSDSQVTLRVVKYPELMDTIKQLKGKLVVVDFWSTT